MSGWPGKSGMTLKTINQTVNIRTTTIVNGDMRFSFLSFPYTYTLVERFWFPILYMIQPGRSRIVAYRIRTNNKRDCLWQRAFGYFQLNEWKVSVSIPHRGKHLIICGKFEFLHTKF